MATENDSEHQQRSDRQITHHRLRHPPNRRIPAGVGDAIDADKYNRTQGERHKEECVLQDTGPDTLVVQVETGGKGNHTDAENDEAELLGASGNEILVSHDLIWSAPALMALWISHTSLNRLLRPPSSSRSVPPLLYRRFPLIPSLQFPDVQNHFPSIISRHLGCV